MRKVYEETAGQPWLVNRLDMKRILLNFGRYISQIGVKAFYAEEKPYEKTGQFLLIAWLYQFVKSGKGDVRDEVLSGKYLATGETNEGYLVVFDTRIPVGAVCKPQTHPVGDKQVLSFTIAIGKP